MTQELRRLAEAATQGPWIAAGPSYGDPMPRFYNAVVIDSDDPIEDEDICSHTLTSEDALYIAAANPAAILSLLDRLEAAEKDAERYRWLRDRYMAVDFDWQGQQAVIFTADDFPVATASCDETIDCAMEASK